MQTKWIAAALCGGLALADGATAHAADANAVQAKYDAAIARVTSFQVSLSGPSGLSGVATYVKPDRVDITTAIGPATTELVQVGGTRYTRANGAAWDAHAVSADAGHAVSPAAVLPTTMTPLADRRENGVTVGAFRSQTTLPLAGESVPKLPATCTYDKATYLPRTCTIVVPSSPEPFTISFAKWNDRTNVVAAPAGVVASPAPEASK